MVSKISQIFICYAHDDNDSSDRNERWLDRLLIHLAPLQLQEQAEIWSDRKIELGEEWHKEIQTILGQVKAAILLVSPPFLASKYIRDNEVPVLLKNAKDRGVVVLPVLLSECLWKETKFRYLDSQNKIQNLSLSIFQMPTGKPLNSLPKHEQDKVLNQIAQRVFKIVDSETSENLTSEVSEKGMSEFEEITDTKKSSFIDLVKDEILKDISVKQTEYSRLREEIREAIDPLIQERLQRKADKIKEEIAKFESELGNL